MEEILSCILDEVAEQKPDNLPGLNIQRSMITHLVRCNIWRQVQEAKDFLLTFD